MSGKYGHGHEPALIAGYLTAGGLTALAYDAALTGTYSGDVIVGLSSDGSDLTIQSLGGWLSMEGYATSDDYLDEVVTALNAGGYPAVAYTGPDPDGVYGNTAIGADGTTITVTTGWPS